MVPKVFHRIWVGNNSMPKKHEEWWRAWQRLHPDFTFITWSEEDFIANDAFRLLHDKVQQISIFAMKADIMRIAILHEYGGIYIDTDMMPINRIPFCELDADFIICETNTAFMAAKRHCKALGLAVDVISMRDYSIGDYKNIIQLTGPLFLNNVINCYEYKQLPRHRFYPYNHGKTFSTLFLQDLGPVYGAHVWHGSWYEDVLENNKYLEILLQGNALELEEGVSNGRGGSWADVCKEQVGILRDVRGKIIDVIHSTHLGGICTLTEASYSIFSIYKMCLFLQEKKADISAWCIGSGDAVHDGHISSAIAIFDIDTIFVEPNHYVKEKIISSFKGNSNIRVVSKPFYQSGANVSLNIVNPNIAEENGLPDWVVNLSYPDIGGVNYYDILKASGGDVILTIGPILSNCYEKVSIESIDTGDMLLLSEGRTPDILSIEANGMEGVILSDIINKNLAPKIISILESGLCNGIRPFLLSSGYDFVGQENSRMFFVRRDFIFSYCDYLFIEYGIRSVYDQCLETIFPKLDARHSKSS